MEYIIIYYIYRWNHGILPWSIYQNRALPLTLNFRKDTDFEIIFKFKIDPRSLMHVRVMETNEVN